MSLLNKYSIGLLFIPSVVFALGSNRDTRLLLDSANGFYDGSYHVSGVVQSDKYFELTDSTSTAPIQPKTGHSKTYLNKTTRQICTEFDDGSITCTLSGNNSCGFGIGQTVQIQSFSIATTSSTTSSTYVPTKLAVTITPKCSTDQIHILATGTLAVSAGSGVNAFVSLFKGTSNLFGAGGGVLVRNDATGQSFVISDTTLQYLDSLASISPVTYTVYFKNSNGTSTIDYPDASGSGTTGYIIATEIAH